MKKIAVMGANAARQKTLIFENFSAGEVNRAARMSESASGKGINFCRAARNWGKACPVVIQFAGGENGDFLIRALAQENIRNATVRCASPLRCCITCIEESSGMATELIEPSYASSAAECREFAELFAFEVSGADGAAICGTLPDGTDPGLYLKVAELAVRHHIPLLLDLFKNAEKLFTLPGTVLKINRRELAALTGCGETAPALKKLFDRFPLTAAAITDGPGKAWCCDGRNMFCCTIPALDKVVNPIGCGDTASAVLLSELLDGRPLIEAFKLALGAGSANAATLLPADFDTALARRFAELITVEQQPFDRMARN